MFEALFNQILSGIITGVFLSILIARLYRPNLIYGFPYNSFFNVEEVGKFQVNTIFVSNIGKKEAEDVCLFFQKKPDHFTLSPAIDYETKDMNSKQFMLRIPSLAAKNMFMVQLFSYKEIPDFKGIRVKTGKVRQLEMIPQPQYAKKFTYIAGFLMILGFGLLIYLSLEFLSNVFSFDIRSLFFRK